jgi:hypothetical protein
LISEDGTFQQFPELRPPPPPFCRANGNPDGFALTDQHDQLFAPGDAGLD